MSDHQYKFNVTMTCGGCSGAVERVLKKLDGKSHCTALHNSTSSNIASTTLFPSTLPIPFAVSLRSFD